MVLYQRNSKLINQLQEVLNLTCFYPVYHSAPNKTKFYNNWIASQDIDHFDVLLAYTNEGLEEMLEVMKKTKSKKMKKIKGIIFINNYKKLENNYKVLNLYKSDNENNCDDNITSISIISIEKELQGDKLFEIIDWFENFD